MYPSLGLTESDSISLIWTYRDNEIVNLPWNLLVDGDVIMLGPSRVAPAGCKQVSIVVETLLKVLQKIYYKENHIPGNSLFRRILYKSLHVMRCAILDQTLTNGIRMVGQNAILTS